MDDIFLNFTNIFKIKKNTLIHSKLLSNLDIKEINIFEEIRINDLILIYKNKTKHDIEIEKLKYLTK